MEAMARPGSREHVDDVLGHAARVLERAARREPLHARSLAEQLELLDNASRLRTLLQVRAESLVATGAPERTAAPALGELLRAERTRAGNAKLVVERLAGMLWRSHEGALRSALGVLAAQLAAMLELRIFAERALDPGEARALDSSRDAWLGVARAATAPEPRGARAAAGAAIPLRPLAGRVLLSIARSPIAQARLTALLEEAGATTVLADSHAVALSLLRWFHVDAALCALEPGDATLLRLPVDARKLDGCAASPLWVALLDTRASLAPEHASSLGFDAAIPVHLSEPAALTIPLGLAIQVRKVNRRSPG